MTVVSRINRSFEPLPVYEEEVDEAKTDVGFSSPPPPDVSFSHRIVRKAIPTNILDEDAVKVVRRLTRFGYEAYFVGGCIRDILFGRQPKDFDIATSALPSEIKRLFRNCRLIGRRFRLAHLLFKNGKVIEVATFRRSATKEDDISERHAAENLFGGPPDDAIRRDFTINALMYDVIKKEIHDYVGGLNDVSVRSLNTIGDPNRRLTEDPVRIIRAVKFAERLDISIEPELLKAMKRHAGLVTDCASARLVEEVFKLLRSGASAKCFETLHDIGVLRELMPVLARNVAEAGDRKRPWYTLARLDEKIQDGNHVSDSTMLAAFIYPFCCQILENDGDVAVEFEEVLAKLFDPIRFTKRNMAHVRQIFLAQRRLASRPSTKRSRRILEREYTAHALDLKELTTESEEDKEVLSAWLEAFRTRKSSKNQHKNTRRRKVAPQEKGVANRPPRHRRGSRL